MLRLKTSVWFTGLFAFFILVSPAAQAQTGEEIMQEVNAVMGHFPSAVAEVNLITGKDNRKRERVLRLVSKQGDGRRQLIATFREPAAVRGVGFSTELDIASDERQSWVYLPSLGGVRELKGNQQHESFFGSDFSYSDLMGRDAEQDTHELVSQDDDFYAITSTPKSKKDAYSKLDYKIAKSDNTIREITFYDRKGAALKRLTNIDFEKVDGVPVLLKSEMKNLKSGSVTLLDRTSIQVAVELFDYDFGPEALQ